LVWRVGTSLRSGRKKVIALIISWLCFGLEVAGGLFKFNTVCMFKNGKM